jgi:hypothetical protein
MTSLLYSNGSLIWYNGALAVDTVDLCDCICGDEGVSVCGCDNLPTTLYVYDTLDDSLLATLTYTDPLTNNGNGVIPAGKAGWEVDQGGGMIEFWCDESPLEWVYDDEEGGTDRDSVTACTGVLANFTAIFTGSGSVYVSTTPP